MPKAITVIFSLAPPPPLDLVCGGGGGGRLGAQREDPTFFPLKTRERKMSPCPKKRKGKGGICILSSFLVFFPFQRRPYCTKLLCIYSPELIQCQFLNKKMYINYFLFHQTLNSISAEKNSTIIFPLPIDFITHFLGKGSSSSSNSPSSPPPPPSAPPPSKATHSRYAQNEIR